jgi:urease accessory protein UreE
LPIERIKFDNLSICVPLQKPVDMADGDVVITDDKSTVYISYNGESVTLSTKTIKLNRSYLPALALICLTVSPQRCKDGSSQR